MSQDSSQSTSRDPESGSNDKPSTPSSKEAASPFLSLPQRREEIDEAKVARAKKLLEEEGYPSRKVLRSVAQHLARNWPVGESEGAAQPRQ
jgi:hypothetical protein